VHIYIYIYIFVEIYEHINIHIYTHILTSVDIRTYKSVCIIGTQFSYRLTNALRSIMP